MKKQLIVLMMAIASTSKWVHAEGMDHGSMDHSSMDHSQMDLSKMDHSNMSMKGMSAVGMPAHGAKPDKVVHVILSDDMTIDFKRDVKIEPNDVVQFVVMNTGKMDHEFVIGSHEEQQAHREMMATMEGDHHHDSGNSVTVAPGKAKQILWHFHGEKEVEFACNMLGHAESGMIKKISL
ncbi:copper-resistant cuproprotein CopI [Vibrio agarivorans]|uniref:copper-resistant cuproprotein CopI n=1 Tax=Vibrio agarivorans TaxID=153622 RepID=UPI0022300599|nr:copper-binding protein [Vibrio agarivorans]